MIETEPEKVAGDLNNDRTFMPFYSVWTLSDGEPSKDFK